MKKKESFESVIDKVKTEREFQDVCVTKYFKHHKKHGAIDFSRPLAAEILMMQEYLDKARNSWTHGAKDDDALAKIRCVAAMAIRAMEYHGCPDREAYCDYKIEK